MPRPRNAIGRSAAAALPYAASAQAHNEDICHERKAFAVKILFGIEKVELVEPGGWWAQHGNALLLATAAIAAAGLAAFVAIRNQRQQLNHDRFLRSQDHIRDTIDAVLVSANEARNIMERLTAAVETMEETRDEGEDIPPRFFEEAERVRTSSLTNLQGMRAAQIRLETRLGESHPIATSHWDTVMAYGEIFTESQKGLVENRDPAVREKDEDREESARARFVDFQDACHAWFRALEKEAR